MNKYQEAIENIERETKQDSYYCDDIDWVRVFDENDVNIKLLKELVDKATPKKPNKLTYKLLLDDGWKYECPRCKCAIGINTNAFDYTQEESFCPTCSQAIDWSKDE